MSFRIPLLLAALATLPLQAQAAQERYTIDPMHTFPSFEADHMGMSHWRGKFNRTTGTLLLDKTAGKGSVEVEIDPASIDYGLDALNTWAVGKELLDTAKYPKVTYRGELRDFVDGAPTRVQGQLTLHGVTRPVELRITRFKCMPHPLSKRDWCGADAEGSFDRAAFDLDAGKDYGFDMTIALRIQVEATRDK
jgi:polyisoprenoid-binding protein YceI